MPLAGREESPLGRSSPQRPAAGDRIFRRRYQDQLVTRSIMCQYPSPLTFKFFSTISGQNVPNRHPKFVLGNNKPRFCTQLDPQVRTWEQKAPVLYSTGIPATSFRRDIPDRPVVLPNSCTSISLLRHSVAGQCAAIAEIGRCCTSIGLLRSCRAVQCAAMRETELRRAVTVGVLHVNRPHRPLAGRVIVQHRLKMDSGAQVLHKTTLLRPSWGCCAAVLGKRGRIE